MTDKPSRVDWWQIITELNRAGITHEAIGHEVGVVRQTVNYWRNNEGQPKFEEGQKLIALWRRALDKQADPLPRKAMFA